MSKNSNLSIYSCSIDKPCIASIRAIMFNCRSRIVGVNSECRKKEIAISNYLVQRKFSRCPKNTKFRFAYPWIMAISRIIDKRNIIRDSDKKTFLQWKKIPSFRARHCGIGYCCEYKEEKTFRNFLLP